MKSIRSTWSRFIVLLSVTACGFGMFAHAAQTRVPVPEEAARSNAQKDVRDLFKEEFKVRTDLGYRALALAMLQQANSKDVKDDPASRYVLLYDARNAALNAGDFQLARSAVEAISDGFDVDAMQGRMEMLSRASKTIYGDEGAQIPDADAKDIDIKWMDKSFRSVYQQELALQWLLLVEDALKADRISVGENASAQATLTASRTEDTDLQNAARIAAQKIDAAKGADKTIAAMKEKLKANPDDPDTNLTLGKYYCFVRDDWNTGRPYLIKGSDATLKALAERDADVETKSADPMSLANEWWRFTDDQGGEGAAITGKGRAAYWYRKQLPSLSGLKKAMADKRIAEFDTLATASNHGQVVDLLALIDLNTAKKKGDWHRSAAGITCTTQQSNIAAPYSPPEEYDVYVDFIRDSGRDTIGLTFPMAKGWAGWIFGSQMNHEEGITDANARWWIRSGLRRGIENNKLYHTLLKVRKDRVRGFANGELVSDLRTNGQGMKVDVPPMIGDQGVLSMRTAWAKATITSWHVLEVTGQGKIVTMPAAEAEAPK